MVLDEDFTKEMLRPKLGIDTNADLEYNKRVANKALERSETEKVRKAVRDIGSTSKKGRANDRQGKFQ